jgi:hypothetical protein
MSIYLVYFGIGLAVFLAGMGGFYLVDRVTDPAGEGPDDGAELDSTAALFRSVALFVAIVGFGGVLFGGVGVAVDLLA